MVKGENWLPQMSLACTCSCIYTYKIKKCNNYKTKESRGRSTSTSWLHNFVKLKFTCKIIITLELFHIPFLIVPSWQWYNHPGIPLSLLCTCPPTVSLAIQSCKIHWSSINLLGHLYFSFIIALHHFICLFYLAKAKKMIKINYIFLPITIWLIQKLCVHVYVHKCLHMCSYMCICMWIHAYGKASIFPNHSSLYFFDKGSLTNMDLPNSARLDGQQSLQYLLVSMFSVLGLQACTTIAGFLYGC